MWKQNYKILKKIDKMEIKAISQKTLNKNLINIIKK